MMLPKEIAKIVLVLETNGCDELADKLIAWHNEEMEKFGKVSWTAKDIKFSLENKGIKKPTEEQIEEVMEYLDEDDLCDHMIQEGWEDINAAVRKYLKDKEIKEND